MAKNKNMGPILAGGALLILGAAMAASMSGDDTEPERDPEPEPRPKPRVTQAPAPERDLPPIRRVRTTPSVENMPVPKPEPRPAPQPAGQVNWSPDVAEKIIEAYPRSRGIIGPILALASEIGAHPVWVANLIHFETGGSFSPQQWNGKQHDALGLIQFRATTAAELLGLPVSYRTDKGYPRYDKATLREAMERLEAMTATEQMKYVRKHLVRIARSRGKLDTKHRLYMAVFQPSAVNKGPNDWLSNNVAELAEIRAKNNGIDTPAKYSAKVEKGAKIVA